MTQLEMWRLHSFLVLAKELHFGRAAERLNITQPTLSRQVQTLEAQIGVPLLIRGPHSVSLTAAGRELRQEGERLLAHTAQAVNRTQRIARGDLGQVSVGFVGSAVSKVVRCVATMKERHPDVAFSLSERPYTDPTSGLLAGDDEFVVARDLAAGPDWRLIPLGVEQSYLVVSHTHPLADRDHVRSEEIEKLRDEIFISTRRWMSVWGFHPRNLWEVVSTQATLQLVNAGVGVSIMPGGYQTEASGTVRFIPVQGMTSALQLALSRTTLSPAAEEFLSIVVQD